MAWNTGSRSPGELEMTRNTSEVAVCCSSASERWSRASASSRVRASSCFFNSMSELGPLLTRALAFVPVERSLRPRVELFAPLRDKVTSSAQSLVPPSGRPSQGSGLPILTAPHYELAALHLSRSFDHLVGAGEQRRRHFEAERHRGRQVDHEVELRRLHDRQIGRLLALENAAGVDAHLTQRIVDIGAVAHQAPRLGIVARRK